MRALTQQRSRDASLHMPMYFFYKNFDRLVTILWSGDEDLKKRVRTEILNYFEKVMCSSHDINEEEFVHQKPIIAASDTREEADCKITIPSDADRLEGDNSVDTVCEVLLNTVLGDDNQVDTVCRVSPTIMGK
jgi:hypothetical protein